MKPVPSLPPFRRATIADQAASALRDAIGRGSWGALLPGEHELARRLGISRPSVHAALVRLSAQGLVAMSKGRRTRLISPRRGAPQAAPPTVCVVSPASKETMGRGRLVLLELRATLAAQGIGWEEIYDATLGAQDPQRRLRELVAGRQGVCWLIIGTPAPIQRWFEAAGVPALVLGSCFRGVSLPSVDIDHHAIGWHAAGAAAQNGHRHVALVLPSRPLAGDMAFRDGFLGYGSRGSGGISLVEVSAGSGAATLRSKLDHLLAQPTRPTAIVAARTEYALTTLVHVLRRGLRIPGDMSLVCRDADPTLGLGIPELTHYAIPAVKLARRAARVVQSLLAGGPVSVEPNLIIPAFVAGTTLSRPGATSDD